LPSRRSRQGTLPAKARDRWAFKRRFAGQ
jgi:hypothetical protein